jgi:hypothetical protein
MITQADVSQETRNRLSTSRNVSPSFSRYKEHVMSVKKLLGSSFVFASLLLACASPAFAHGGPSETHQKIVERVTWTLSAADCTTLHSDLHGVGVRHEEITTKVNRDGSVQIDTHDSVDGAASDSSFSHYKFSYENHTVELVPSSSGAHQVSMVDTFAIEGKGPAGHLVSSFNWRWTYTPPADMWPPVDNWQKIYTRGDSLHCDPI